MAVPAAAEEVERITQLLFESLCASGYLQTPDSATERDKLRRLLRRMHLNKEDAELWLGMLRKMLWKLKR